MKRTLLFMVCGLAVVLAACQSNNVEPPAPLVKFTSTANVAEVWSHSIGAADAVLRLGIVAASDGSNVYAASGDGDVYAFRLKDGTQLWKVETGFDFSGGPGVGGGRLVITARNGTVLALDAASGRKLWQTNVDALVLASPAVTDSTVILHAADGHVIALSSGTGAKLWNVSREPAKLSLRGVGTPLIVGDTAYIGFSTGKLVALNMADGSQRWEYAVSSPTGGDVLSRLSDLDGTISYDAGTLYAVSFQGKVAALAADSGQMLWSREMSSYTGASTDAQHVYVSDAHGSVWALNKETGTPVWTQPALHARDVTLPVPYMDTVVVGDIQGYLHFMSASDGSFVARVSLDSDAIQAPPIVAGGLLVALSTGGELAAYRIVKADGKR